ncbi:MAG: hypothetical protein HY434_00035 [Candidatus Liptonbacteria bacterium]|nr:hypothetical protein [Candidatus Liptonbacteria bacterium]
MKIINIILGLGTAIIIGALIHLGIRAFHPEPKSPYDAGRYPKPVLYQEFNCDKSDAQCVADRNAFYKEQQARQEEMDKQNRAYEQEMKVYNSDVFVAANIVGIVVFVAGFLVLFRTAIASRSVPIGVMVAGLYGIIYGYARGWNSVNDQLKFFVGLAVALLVVGGSMWLMERYGKGKGRNAKGA